VSVLKVPSVRLRGPRGVSCDSRISQEPLPLGTTYAIVGQVYHYKPGWLAALGHTFVQRHPRPW
jgi:hypothetical protein